ncbi:hypothetical protein [Aeromonas caviae]|nr:hypothetical protein [Aeromonas caviae]
MITPTTETAKEVLRGYGRANEAAQHLFCCLGGGCNHGLASCAYSVG